LTFEEILGVLLGWLGLEIEVGTHGANGAQPVAAVDVQEELHRGDELGSRSASASSVLFVLRDGDGSRSGASDFTSRHTKAAAGTTMTKKSLKSAAASFRS
jgi:hypothetical protein